MDSGAVRGARPVALAIAAAMVVAAVVSGLAPNAAAQGSGDAPPPVLDQDMRGEAAIRALGSRLPAVAAQNDRSPAEFKAALRKDSMLWVGRSGQLLFVDELDQDHDHAEPTDLLLGTASVPPDTDVFALHSRPGAERVIVLDFNGHDARGTAWGSSRSQIAKPYDSDGDPASFSSAERAEIYSVWQRVAEDYAPFAVDVTTKDPGHGPGSTGADIIRRATSGDETYGTRVVITPTKTYNCNCGGVAYVGVYNAIGDTHDHYQPAWVFTSGVGNGAKNIAEAASHEAGHNLGLSHDGTTSSGYYTGHGNWAPIMGVGYYEPITQWSQGEYSGANNNEDDFVVAASYGAPLMGDDHGDTPTSATPVAVDTSTTGLIHAGDDTDVFTVTPPADGPVTVTVTPAATSPNLDIELRLLGSDIVIDPPSGDSTGNDTSVGLGAELVIDAVAGTTYHVQIDGVGFGDVLGTGYSDYGSVGRYKVSVATGGGTVTEPEDPGTEDPVNPLPATPADFAAVVEASTVRLTWTDTTNETGYEIVREKKDKGSWIGRISLPVGQDLTEYLDGPGNGTFRYAVSAVNDAGSSAFTAWIEVKVGGGGKPVKAR